MLVTHFCLRKKVCPIMADNIKLNRKANYPACCCMENAIKLRFGHILFTKA